jgi:Zn-dependent protease
MASHGLASSCLTVTRSRTAVARRFDVQVRSITLFLFGGVAEIQGELPTPAQEFAVALVGPAVSVLLGGVFGLGPSGRRCAACC